MQRVVPCLVIVGLAGLAGLAGCHVVTRGEITRPGATERVGQGNDPTPGRPTLVLSDAGTLRFVEPLECSTEELVREQHAVETTTGPNLATFVVGVISSAVGGVLVVRGVAGGERASDPGLLTGGVLVAAGLPFAIGPWIGNGTTLEPLPDRAPVRRAGPRTACGERPLAARAATLVVQGIEIHGSVDRDGAFAVSPFAIVDAFAASSPALAIAARIETATGARAHALDAVIDTVIDGATIARHAPAFLARADFDARIEPMRVLPGIVAGTLRASLTSLEGEPAVRIVLPIHNDGPGDAFALRGEVTAPGTPAIDGRILYVGRVAKGAAITRELLIPVTRSAAEALRNATLDLGIELRDAHGTAPTTPVRFRGPIFVDAPR